MVVSSEIGEKEITKKGDELFAVQKCDLKIKENRQAYNRKYYQEHKEKIKVYKREYYQEHKEERKAYQGKHYQEHKEERKAYQKAYQQKRTQNTVCDEDCFNCKYPDCIVEMTAIEKRRAYWREYHQKHKEKRNASARKYQQEHKEKIKAYNREYQREYQKRPEVRRKRKEARQKKRQQEKERRKNEMKFNKEDFYNDEVIQELVEIMEKNNKRRNQRNIIILVDDGKDRTSLLMNKNISPEDVTLLLIAALCGHLYYATKNNLSIEQIAEAFKEQLISGLMFLEVENKRGKKRI